MLLGLGSGPINFVDSALADFGAEQAQDCRKYNYFQSLATHSEAKSAAPGTVSHKLPISGEKPALNRTDLSKAIFLAAGQPM